DGGAAGAPRRPGAHGEGPRLGRRLRLVPRRVPPAPGRRTAAARALPDRRGGDPRRAEQLGGVAGAARRLSAACPPDGARGPDPAGGRHVAGGGGGGRLRGGAVPLPGGRHRRRVPGGRRGLLRRGRDAVGRRGVSPVGRTLNGAAADTETADRTTTR